MKSILILTATDMNTFAQALSHALDRCIATRTVYNQGDAVGFLYREEPVFEHDNG